jgi:CRP/FNR family transcriptional regulator
LWRKFVFDLLSQRLSTVLAVVEEVAFHRMDTRVAALLLERGSFSNPVPMTHQEIAAELGSSREVVSRILEDFERQGLTHAMRGAVQILDVKSLEARASM